MSDILQNHRDRNGKIKRSIQNGRNTYFLVTRKSTGETTGRCCRGRSSFLSVGKVGIFRIIGTLAIIFGKFHNVMFDIFSSHSPKIKCKVNKFKSKYNNRFRLRRSLAPNKNSKILRKTHPINMHFIREFIAKGGFFPLRNESIPINLFSFQT